MPKKITQLNLFKLLHLTNIKKKIKLRFDSLVHINSSSSLKKGYKISCEYMNILNT